MILIASNLFMVYWHYAIYRSIDAYLLQASNPELEEAESLSLPPIIHEAIEAMIADEMQSYRYETIWELWPYLRENAKRTVLERVANDMEKIDSAKDRIDILNRILTFSKEHQMIFSEQYNKYESLDNPDPFGPIHSSYRVHAIDKWQVRDEMSYLVAIYQCGLTHRYCLYLKANAIDQKKFCDYLMDVYRRNSKTKLGYAVLVMYFVNFPSNEPISYNEAIPIDTVESVINDAARCVLRYGIRDSVSNMEEHLQRISPPGK
jgi:hypothetical protein